MNFRIFVVLGAVFIYSYSAQAIPVPQHKPQPQSYKSHSETKHCATALKHAKNKNLNVALAHAPQQTCPVTNKLVQWLRLRQGAGDITFQEYADFISQNTHWPWIVKLRDQAEKHITTKTPKNDLIKFFQAFPPRTAKGALAHIDALFKTKKTQQAITAIRSTWKNQFFKESEQQVYLKRFNKYLRASEHSARANHMLKTESTFQVKRLLPLLSEAEQASARVRIAFLEKKDDAGDMAKNLSANQQKQLDFLYDWIKWHRKKDNLEGAYLFLKQIPAKITKTPAWFREQMALARESLNQGNPQLAYRMLEHQPWKTGREFIEAEWFMGWIALTYLNQPEKAYNHFRAMARDARSPISRARAYYWLGRVVEDGSQPERARNWYQKSAEYGATFYGQQSMQKLGQCRSVNLKIPTLPKGQDFDAATHELGLAAQLLAHMQDNDHIMDFLYLVNKRADSPAKCTQAMYLIREVWPDFLVEAIKFQRNTNAWSYPLARQWVHPKSRNPDFILAIIRQESSFNRLTHSPANARGIIQLVPVAAKLMCKKLNLPYDPQRLFDDPAYNLKLGTEYIFERMDDYDGSLVLTAASYNAGPGSVRKWLRRNGDPRNLKGDDLIQWIELISYGETRDYVQLVLANYEIYRQILTGKCDGRFA